MGNRRQTQNIPTPDGITDLNFDGIPRLQRTISETGASIPTDKEHSGIRSVEKQFGLAEEYLMAPLLSHLFGYATVHGRIRFSSVKDVVGLVKRYPENIRYALGATKVEIHSKMATFNIRPNLWVVSVAGIPIRVVDVETPGKPRALGHPNSLVSFTIFLRRPLLSKS